jgi:cellulose synthase/poly-beta-1,6-N-acetylglucosamine synthase-like glycosyltransferase
MHDLYELLVTVVMTFGLVHFFLAMTIGTWVERQLLRRQYCGYVDEGKPVVDAVFVLVPCRDEEGVIAATISALVNQDAKCSVVVIDDGSTDATARIVGSILAKSEGRVRLVRRVLPNARKGKGPALNFGFQDVLRAVEERGLDPARVVICVMDADGRLSDGALRAVLPAFDVKSVGGVQLPVSIRNRTNLVSKMVHFEFWGYSAISQFGRNVSRTVSLGGNGQFTRLSALLEIGCEPWSSSLTEDLDLAVSLAIRGWELRMVPGAFVDQQAVTTVKTYVKQRARWFQGHMTTSFRIPEVWRSRHLTNIAMIELVTYLTLPFSLILPWSILGQIVLFDFVCWLWLASYRSTDGAAQVFLYLFVYVISLLPNLVLAVLYSRRDRSGGLVQALALAHTMLFFNYLSYIAAWLGLFRILRGSTSWDKTKRSIEPAVRISPPVDLA